MVPEIYCKVHKVTTQLGETTKMMVVVTLRDLVVGGAPQVLREVRNHWFGKKKIFEKEQQTNTSEPHDAVDGCFILNK